MPYLTTLLKSAVIASAAAFSATTAAAQDFTVHIYERGFFPNIVYTADASRIRFVNETNFDVGIDATTGFILVRRIEEGDVGYLDLSTLNGRTIRTPFIYGVGRYSGSTFEVRQGAAPDS